MAAPESSKFNRGTVALDSSAAVASVMLSICKPMLKAGMPNEPAKLTASSRDKWLGMNAMLCSRAATPIAICRMPAGIGAPKITARVRATLASVTRPSAPRASPSSIVSVMLTPMPPAIMRTRRGTLLTVRSARVVTRVTNSRALS